MTLKLEVIVISWARDVALGNRTKDDVGQVSSNGQYPPGEIRSRTWLDAERRSSDVRRGIETLFLGIKRRPAAVKKSAPAFQKERPRAGICDSSGRSPKFTTSGNRGFSHGKRPLVMVWRDRNSRDIAIETVLAREVYAT